MYPDQCIPVPIVVALVCSVLFLSLHIRNALYTIISTTLPLFLQTRVLWNDTATFRNLKDKASHIFTYNHDQPLLLNGVVFSLSGTISWYLDSWWLLRCIAYSYQWCIIRSVCAKKQSASPLTEPHGGLAVPFSRVFPLHPSLQPVDVKSKR